VQAHRARLLGRAAGAKHRRPKPARRPQLGDAQEHVDADRKRELDLRRRLLDREPLGLHRPQIGDAGGQRVGEVHGFVGAGAVIGGGIDGDRCDLRVGRRHVCRQPRHPLHRPIERFREHAFLGEGAERIGAEVTEHLLAVEAARLPDRLQHRRRRAEGAARLHGHGRGVEEHPVQCRLESGDRVQQNTVLARPRRIRARGAAPPPGPVEAEDNRGGATLQVREHRLVHGLGVRMGVTLSDVPAEGGARGRRRVAGGGVGRWPGGVGGIDRLGDDSLGQAPGQRLVERDAFQRGLR